MAELFLSLSELSGQIQKGRNFQLVEPFFDDRHNVLLGTEKVLTTRDVEKIRDRFPSLLNKPLRVYTTVPHFIPEAKRVKWTAYLISLFEGSKLYKGMLRASKEFVVKYLKNLLTEQDYVILKLSQLKNFDQTIFKHSCHTCFISLIIYHSYNRTNYQGMVDANVVSELMQAALLHDVGLMDMDKRIATKKRFELTEAENIFFTQHPLKSREMILSESDKHELSPEVIEAVLDHEEYVNGTGSPRGIGGEDMSHTAKIISLANYFELLFSGSYSLRQRPARDYIMKLRSNKGNFDAGVFSALDQSFKHLFKR